MAEKLLDTLKRGSTSLIKKVVGWQGLEPWTNALKGHCSTN
jgi:hypothetical protein